MADLDSRTVDNPITWSEFAEIAEKCTTDDYVGAHIIMDHGEGLPYALEPMYLSAGKDYISEDGTTSDGYVNSEEAVTTTAYLADMIAKGWANVEPITDEFLNGACATMLGGSWEIATLTENADFEWGRNLLSGKRRYKRSSFSLRRLGGSDQQELRERRRSRPVPSVAYEHRERCHLRGSDRKTGNTYLRL